MEFAALLAASCACRDPLAAVRTRRRARPRSRGPRGTRRSSASPTSGSATTSCTRPSRAIRRRTCSIRSSRSVGRRRRPRRSASARACSSAAAQPARAREHARDDRRAQRRPADDRRRGRVVGGVSSRRSATTSTTAVRAPTRSSSCCVRAGATIRRRFHGAYYSFDDIRVCRGPRTTSRSGSAGAASAAYRRGVELGDGYQIIGVTPDEATPVIERLRRDRPGRRRSRSRCARDGIPHGMEPERIRDEHARVRGGRRATRRQRAVAQQPRRLAPLDGPAARYLRGLTGSLSAFVNGDGARP